MKILARIRLTLFASLVSLTGFCQERFMGFTLDGGENEAGTIFLINSDGSNFHVVHHMNPETDGGENLGSPYLSSDGYCYGMANTGGDFDSGTIFRIKKDGSEFTVLRHLNPSAGDGINPAGSTFIEDGNGFLYGITAFGGTTNEGTIFKIRRDGTGYEVLKSFTKDTEGGTAQGSLLLHPDNKLYGMTQIGTPTGPAAGGSIFKINTNGTDFEIIKYFDSLDPVAFVHQPFGNLIYLPDGFLYGMTREGVRKGGPGGTRGCVFKIRPDGSNFTVIHFFEVLHGQEPFGSLLSSNGFLFGMTRFKGQNNAGTVFRLKPDGTEFVVLRSFVSTTEGGYPRGSLIEGRDGYLYGQTYGGNGLSLGDGSFNGGSVFKMRHDGTDFKVLKLLNPTTDGALGRGDLVRVGDIVTSTPELLSKINPFFYPNPSTGQIFFSRKEGSISIIDMFGKQITGFDLSSVADTDVYLTNLPKAVYVIKYSNKNEVLTERLVLN